MAVQIQFSHAGRRAIAKECRETAWPAKLADFGQECGLREVCHVTFTNLHSMTAPHAHELETHAQRTMIKLTSRDPHGALYQFYCAAAATAKGMSVLKVGLLIDGAPRVLVITVTMWTKRAKREGLPESRA